MFVTRWLTAGTCILLFIFQFLPTWTEATLRMKIRFPLRREISLDNLIISQISLTYHKKNGSQHNKNTPIMIPKVRAALCSLRQVEFAWRMLVHVVPEMKAYFSYHLQGPQSMK